MAYRGGGSLLLRIVVVALILGGIGIVYVVTQINFAGPAQITPPVSIIGSGQSTPITVSWSGGVLPYTVYLYSSTTKSCSSDSVLWAAKPDLDTPGYTFSVTPTTTTYYCGTVSSSKGSSAVSQTVSVTVNPPLRSAQMTISPTSIDSGQTATVMATVSWVNGTSPYSVTLYRGINSTCALDTTRASLVSGVNPQTGLAAKSATFQVKDPVSTYYYCAVVTDSTTTPESVSTTPSPFVVNAPLKASITPAAPTADKGQTVHFKAVPIGGTAPYFYQWYNGTDCQTGGALSGETASEYNASATSSSMEYSVYITDSGAGIPPQSACGSATGVVNSQFNGTTVTLSPSSYTTDLGLPSVVTVSWGSVGSLPYSVQLRTSATSSCAGSIPFGPPKIGVGRPMTAFTVYTNSTTYFCATVSDSATVPESVNSTTAVLVAINPTLSPTLSVTPPAIDLGQSASVSITVNIVGGTAPYAVKLFSGTGGTCSDLLIATVSSGSNPVTGATGPTTTFDVPLPASSLKFCAQVTDKVGSVVDTPVESFDVNPVLAATISPLTPQIDIGQSIVLTAKPTDGTPTYGYQWYNGTDCQGANLNPKKTSVTYSTGVLTASKNYSVMVSDSGGGTPADTVCADVLVTVNSALNGPTITLTPSAMDTGQSLVITATIDWSGGTSPYTVALTSGTSPTCSSDTTKVTVDALTNPRADVTTNSTKFTFAQPSTSTYYCASITDSSVTPQSESTSTAKFTVNPALGSPSATLSPKVIDFGQTATLNVTFSWSGGTSPYTVFLHSGTSTTCSSDTTLVALSSGTNPRTNVTSDRVSFEVLAPASTTDYCVTTLDSAPTPESTSSAVMAFTVNPTLTAKVIPYTPAIDSGQAVTVTLTAEPLGGTSPYFYQWYSGGTCSSALSGKTSQSYTTGTISVTTTFSVRVKDNSTGTPAASYCASTTVSVNPPLSVPTLTLSPDVIDKGQTATITSDISWSGGTTPYMVSLYSGYSSTCSSDTTKVASAGELLVTSATQSSTSPSVTTYYCAVVQDNATTPSTETSAAVAFTVDTAVSASISCSPYIDCSIVSGQTVTLAVSASGGTPAYSYQWYSGASCSTAISGQTSTSYAVSPSVTTSYSVKVGDSSLGTPAAGDCVSQAVTVGQVLSAPSIILTPGAIDSGQTATLNATVVWGGGVSPYEVTLYSGTSTSCSSDTLVVGEESGVAALEYSFFPVAPGSDTQYCASVTDSTSTPSTTSTASPTEFVIEGTLSASVSPSSYFVDGQQLPVSVTLTASVAGGVSPFAYKWYSSTSGAPDCSPGDLVADQASSSYAASPSSTTYYSVLVSDSSTGTPAETYCAAATVTVGSSFTGFSMLLSPTSIDSGQTATIGFALSWSGGTSPYTVKITAGFSSTSCASDDTAVSGGSAGDIVSDSTTIDVASPSATTFYCATVTDSASTVATLASSSPSSFTINSALKGTISPSPATIDSGQTITLTVSASLGTPPYSYQWYSGSGCSTALSGQTLSSYTTPALGSTTTYSVKVGDSSAGTPAAGDCVSQTVTVVTALSAAVTPSSPTLDSGQTVTLTAEPSQGVSPYSYQWYTGTGCTTGLSGQTSQSFETPALSSSTQYSVLVSDSSSGAPATACAAAAITVNPAFSSTSVSVSPSSVTVDNGGSVTFTVDWASAGTSPFTVELTTSSSSDCASPTLAATKTGLSGTTTTFTLTPSSSAYYCATVTDSAYSPESASATLGSDVAVNPALGAPSLVLSPSAIDSGQSATVAAQASWTGGTPTYTISLYSGSSLTCSSDALVSTVSGVGGTTYTFNFAAPGADTEYCVTLTDSASGAVVNTSPTVEFVINPALSASVTPSAATVDSGQAILLSASPTSDTPSSGTAPYSYQWYTGSTCTAAIAGSTSSTYTTGSLTSASSFSVLVTDSSPGTPAATSCASASISVNPALAPPTISVSSGSISSGGSAQLSTTTSFSGGTSGYTCQWLVEGPSAESYSDLGSSFACSAGATPTISTGVLSTTGTWSFELQVTDSSYEPATVYSNAVTVTVS